MRTIHSGTRFTEPSQVTPAASRPLCRRTQSNSGPRRARSTCDEVRAGRRSSCAPSARAPAPGGRRDHPAHLGHLAQLVVLAVEGAPGEAVAGGADHELVEEVIAHHRRGWLRQRRNIAPERVARLVQQVVHDVTGSSEPVVVGHAVKSMSGGDGIPNARSSWPWFGRHPAAALAQRRRSARSGWTPGELVEAEAATASWLTSSPAARAPHDDVDQQRLAAALRSRAAGASNSAGSCHATVAVSTSLIDPPGMISTVTPQQADCIVVVPRTETAFRMGALPRPDRHDVGRWRSTG